MEKRIGFFEFQQVKSVAKACDPSIRQRDRIKAQIEKLAAEYKKGQSKIDMLEAGIKKIIGFSVEELVKKVIEPDAKGNKVTKYLPTDKVRYDEEAKQYVISVPDSDEGGADIREGEPASAEEPRPEASESEGETIF